jgi:hypothetical protein
MTRAMAAASPVPRCVGAALALAALLGCASPPPSEPTVLMGSGSETLLILPLNVALPMPPELENSSPILWRELEIYLREQGKELKTVSRQVARNLWIRSIQEARAGPKGARAGYDDAASALAVELRKHAEFDAMVAPSLFVREARIENQAASWDGVTRAIEFEFEEQRLGARTTVTNRPLEGVAPGVSLHVAIFDAHGEKLHEAEGGLDLLVRVQVRHKRPWSEDAAYAPDEEPSFEFAPRPDPFGDRAHVREGFNAAFAPFLPPLRD